jgi:preprotein translocase subunit YajC
VRFSRFPDSSLIQLSNKDAQELQKRVIAGASVMTSFGVYATVKSIDDAENKVVLEISPKTTMTVARQAVVRVIDPVVEPAVDEAKK